MGMVDVSGKDTVHRKAVARASLTLREGTIEVIREGGVKKGDPLAAAEVAALLGIKETPSRIPHCHPIPLTSADVAFTYDVLMDENTRTVRRSDFEPIKKLETPDALTVRVTYRRPFVPCLEAWAMGILPRHLLEAQDINETNFNRAPVGTGPFRFEQWRTARTISVTKNREYFEGVPFLDGVTYRIIPDPATLELAFLVGGTDTYSIQPHQFSRYEKDEGFSVYRRLSNGYT